MEGRLRPDLTASVEAPRADCVVLLAARSSLRGTAQGAVVLGAVGRHSLSVIRRDFGDFGVGMFWKSAFWKLGEFDGFRMWEADRLYRSPAHRTKGTSYSRPTGALLHALSSSRGEISATLSAHPAQAHSGAAGVPMNRQPWPRYPTVLFGGRGVILAGWVALLGALTLRVLSGSFGGSGVHAGLLGGWRYPGVGPNRPRCSSLGWLFGMFVAFRRYCIGSVAVVCMSAAPRLRPFRCSAYLGNLAVFGVIGMTADFASSAELAAWVLGSTSLVSRHTVLHYSGAPAFGRQRIPSLGTLSVLRVIRPSCPSPSSGAVGFVALVPFGCSGTGAAVWAHSGRLGRSGLWGPCFRSCSCRLVPRVGSAGSRPQRVLGSLGALDGVVLMALGFTWRLGLVPGLLVPP